MRHKNVPKMESSEQGWNNNNNNSGTRHACIMAQPKAAEHDPFPNNQGFEQTRMWRARCLFLIAYGLNITDSDTWPVGEESARSVDVDVNEYIVDCQLVHCAEINPTGLAPFKFVYVKTLWLSITRICVS